MDCDILKDIDGVPLLEFFAEENVRSAMKYEPCASDVIIATYPKCGTTWTQYIVANILSKASTPCDPGLYMLYTPCIELLGAEAAMNPRRRGPLMTHLPLKKMVFSKQAKYIYVARNPYDCCVSAYYFLKGLTPKSYTDVSFESFVEKFISGKVFYGDYFDHVLDWYEIRNEPYVLFLLYKELKQDPEKWILTIAEFLGREHNKALRRDRTLFERIIQVTSVNEMKSVFNYSSHERIKSLVEMPPESSLKCLQMLKQCPETREDRYEGAGFVRKGIIGDWKNHFTPEQVEWMKKWISEKTCASDVMQLWNAYNLP